MRIDDQTLSVLSAAVTAGNTLRITERLDRAMYAKANKVLEAAGGRWDRKAQAHVFACNASERMEQIILTGEVIAPKDDFDFFPTPPALADLIVAHSGLEYGNLALEPSAGTGAILDAIKRGTTGVTTIAVELNPNMAEKLRGSGQATTVMQQDFLAVQPDKLPKVDAVVMNPPFGKRADIAHVTHAMKFLRPGGSLVAVMSAGVSFRRDRLALEFLSLLERHEGHIEPLPADSFKASGTGVNTVLVTATA